MSAITSASGSTDFSSAGAGPAPAAAGLPLRSSAITSPIGSTTDDLYSLAGGSGVGAAPGAAGVPASTSGPMNVGGA